MTTRDRSLSPAIFRQRIQRKLELSRLLLPDVRIACAQLFVTNSKGNSPASAISLTHNVDNGLRTLSGGQYSIQVEGFLAVDQMAAPALVVDTAHSVRDVFAVHRNVGGSAGDRSTHTSMERRTARLDHPDRRSRFRIASMARRFRRCLRRARSRLR